MLATMSTAERIAFINGLELSEPDSVIAKLRIPTIEPKDGEKAGYVDDGSLVSFVAGVSAQHQHDALNSTLLAQLGANKKYDREEQTVKWYKFYRDVLENVAWVVGDFDFTKFKSGSTTFDVDEVVIELLGAIATESRGPQLVVSPI